MFKDNFNIWRQLEHFEYDMNRTLIFKTESESMYPPKVYIETNLHVAKDFGKHIVSRNTTPGPCQNDSQNY